MFTITATALDSSGTRIDVTSPEFLGDAYGLMYATRGGAEQAAATLRNEAPWFKLPESTEYVVSGPTFDLAASVEWLTANVTDEQWDRLVGAQTRGEFAMAAADNGEDIETAWTKYAAWADKNL